MSEEENCQTTEHPGDTAKCSPIKQRAKNTAGTPLLLQALKKAPLVSFSFALAVIRKIYLFANGTSG